MEPSSLALLELGRSLSAAHYHFVTPTPETHRRVWPRVAEARDLRDVFGWSRPFARTLLPPQLFELLEEAQGLRMVGPGRYLSTVRFSSLGGRLYVHSAYPTEDVDAVFFGPDTYRFCRFLEHTLQTTTRARAPRSVLDVGCGSGAGGLVAARASASARLLLADINTRALAYAAVNARLSARDAERFETEVLFSDVLSDISGELDLIVANPPYMRDDAARVYRDGGGAFGEALSVRIVRESLARLAPGGSLLLYTGAAIVAGEDVFFSGIRELLQNHEVTYSELDPDVFGEELARPGYENVERIAAVGLTVTKQA